jgi:general secretion pathway protein H
MERTEMCAAGNKTAGFTLLELLVVLVLASLAISQVGPAFQRLLPGLQLEAEGRKLVAMLRHARSQAILSGAAVAVSQDADGGLRLSYRPQAYNLPAHLSLALTGGPGQSEALTGAPQILFYPRGDSSGGSLELKQAAGRSELISVDWLSGRVRRGAATVPNRQVPSPEPRGAAGRDGQGGALGNE